MPRVVPDIDAFVEFGGGPAPHPPGVIGVWLVRDAHVVAVVAAPHPAVERALDAALDHAAAVGQVGTPVLTVRVENADGAVEVAKRHQSPPK